MTPISWGTDAEKYYEGLESHGIRQETEAQFAYELCYGRRTTRSMNRTCCPDVRNFSGSSRPPSEAWKPDHRRLPVSALSVPTGTIS